MRKILIFLMMIAIGKIYAITISGKVFNEKEEGLINAVVTCQKQNVLTDNRGFFRIRITSIKDTIIFRRFGFKNKEITAEQFVKNPKVILEKSPIEIDGLTTYGKEDYSILQNNSNKIVIRPNINEEKSIGGIIEKRADLELTGGKLAGETQHINFPGFDNRHTLIMIDNIPVNHAGESFDISNIPVEIIDSIEIMKGASAAIHGSGAMGGVVNIITKRDKRTYNLEVSQKIGSFKFYQSSFSSEIIFKKLRFFTFLSHKQAENDFKYETPDSWNLDGLQRRENNSKRIGQLHSKLNFELANLQIENQFSYNNFFKKLPGPIQNLSLFENSRIKGEVIINRTKLIMPSLNSELNLYISKDFNIYDNSRLDYPFNHNFMYSTFNKNYQSERKLSSLSKLEIANIKTNFGAEYKCESFRFKQYKPYADSLVFNPLTEIPLIKNENFAGFASSTYKKYFDNFEINLSAGVRNDNPKNYSEFTSWNFSPEISYYSFFGNYIFTFAEGESFTLPSFYNLFWKGDTQAVGNPDLLPETSHSRQLKLSYLGFGQKISLEYANQKINDMIIWSQDFNKKWKPLNISEVKIRNFTIDANFTFSDFYNLSASYTNTKAIDRTRTSSGAESSYFGKDLIYTPEYKVSVNNRFEYQDIFIAIDYQRTGAQWSTRDQLTTDKKLPAYHELNCGASYSIDWKSSQIILGTELNNLFNKRYEIYKYVPQPGFNWSFSLKIKYKM